MLDKNYYTELILNALLNKHLSAREIASVSKLGIGKVRSKLISLGEAGLIGKKVVEIEDRKDKGKQVYFVITKKLVKRFK